MIQTAREFFELRTSLEPAKYQRAAQDNAPLEVWQTVLAHYPDMAIWVAHNKTVPYEILEQLSKHPDPRVRHMVASKNKLQTPLLLQLASDPDDTIRMTVVQHRNATKLVLACLTTDSWSEISRLARARIAQGDYLR